MRRAWAEVNLDDIRHNFFHLRGRLHKGCQVMAIVKADAYGHGDGHVARVLDRAGADWFGVSNIHEALSLRRQGIMRPILILGYTPPEQAAVLAARNISQTVYCTQYARALSEQAAKQRVRVDCHIKVDTGMSRIGFFAPHKQSTQSVGEIEQVCRLPGLSCTGIFTHFACADELNEDSVSYTKDQFNAFYDVMTALKQRGIAFSVRHCSNSAGALRFPEMQLDMVRYGDVLYGLPPSPDCAELCEELRPAMSLYSIVTMVKDMPAGCAVSYGRRYETKCEGERLASVAIGYADGYSRSLSNRGRVLVNGRFAPIVGTICMDQLMIDVSGIPDVAPGDVVTLVGGQDGARITFDDLARICQSINYEQVCLIGRRVPRVYIEDGVETDVVDYVLHIG